MAAATIMLVNTLSGYLHVKDLKKQRYSLQAALRDYEAECRERERQQPRVQSQPQQQRSLNGAQATAAVCGGVVFAVGGLVLLFLTLWGLQNLGRAIIK